jgi:outer membrane lipoprotein carrier protein LolA
VNTPRRALALALLLAALAPAAIDAAVAADSDAAAAEPAAADAATLDRLMALLAQREHAVADFEQTQFLSLLKQPAHSSGELRYQAPDHLEQRTLKPRPQSVVLDHGVLTLEVGGHHRSLRLQQYPQLAPLIDSIRATLAGDRLALERGFQLQFEGSLDHWQLLLRPTDRGVAASVQSIRLAGERDAVLEVEVRQSDGDHSLMKITPRE